MSLCSNEICALSEKKSAIKSMASLMEDPSRASPVPFKKNGIVNEAYNASSQGKISQSENVQTSEEGTVHITRKTKVEESLVKSQKMYTAEINSPSQASFHVQATSPEMEQIMARSQVHQSYSDTSQQSVNALSLQQKKSQPERCLTPEIENLMDKPHGSWSPMPAACFVRPISPNHIISYPPDIPPISATLSQPRTATPEQFQEARETVERFVDHSKQAYQTDITSIGRNTQLHVHQTAISSNSQHYNGQKYSPRYDLSQGFSAYAGSSVQRNHDYGLNESQGSYENVKPDTHSNINYGNPSNYKIENAQNPNNNFNGHSRNPGNESQGNDGKTDNKRNGNVNSGDEKFEKPTVTEPENFGEGYSRKSSGTNYSQKSSRKPSVSEEESSRKVFSDFGGPQISSSVEVESVTEGGIQKTSVKKSEKMEYSSCEFESSRSSSIKKDDGDGECFEGNGENVSNTNNEPRKCSNQNFSSEGASINEEELMTKSQVEDIIKQELNKVFKMAQTMEKTNFGEMYNQKSQQASSEQHTKTTGEQSAIQHFEQYSSQRAEQKSNVSQYDIKKSSTDKVVTQTGKLTSGLTIAPDRSFTPQALESNYPLTYQNIPTDYPPPRGYPEPPTSTKPSYVTLTGDRSSPLLNALTIAPERPYSPLPTATVIETPSVITSPKRSSMLEALTTASSTPFHIERLSSRVTTDESGIVKKTDISRYESSQKCSPKLNQGNFKPITIDTVVGESPKQSKTSETCPIKSFPPVTEDLKKAFKSTSKIQSTSTAESKSQQAESSMQIVKSSHQRSSSASRAERPSTPSGLHPPNILPYYQQNIGEIPLAHRSNSPVPHQIKAPSLTLTRSQSLPQNSENKGSVKALSEAYTQQIVAQNNHHQQASTISGASSVSYVSSGAYSTGSVTKTYSYEQDHKSIDEMGYHASPLAGKLPLAGEQTLPKCSSPVLGKLDHTKQVFKPFIPDQTSLSAFRSPVAEHANLRQALPYFVQEKEKSQAPWVIVKEKDGHESVNISSVKSSVETHPSCPIPQPTFKHSLPSFPSVSNTLSAFPEPSKPLSLPGVTKPPSKIPDAGPGSTPKGGTTATSAPRRGRGVLNAAASAGARIPLCGSCNNHIRGPFITALGKIWCPEHFVCVNANCRRQLQDIGFVEDAQGLYCEFCFEQYLAPTCNKCNGKVKGDCLNAIGKHFHPECFTCAYCGKLFGNSPFFLEDALPYCETDWNELFTTKCFSCGFPIEAGDRWVEALNNNYHSQCFNCNMCKKNLEGQSFFAKGGRPFCKNHAR